jgi:serine phosphatase RsbU (regulator of sigma subunit)
LLGAFTDTTWPAETVAVGADDLVLLYTDGVTETAGVSERFGAARLRALISEHAGATPHDLLARLDAEIATFSSGSRRDDIAALALRPAARA